MTDQPHNESQAIIVQLPSTEPPKPPPPPQHQVIEMQVYGRPAPAPSPVPTPPPAPPVPPSQAPVYFPPQTSQQSQFPPPVVPVVPPSSAASWLPRANADGITTASCSWCGKRMVVSHSPVVKREGFPDRYLHFGCFDEWGKGQGSLDLLEARARATGQT